MADVLLAARIKALRKARNLTQQQLSELIGVPQTTLSALERGDLDVKAVTLCDMARVFKVPAGELLSSVCAQLPTDEAA